MTSFEGPDVIGDFTMGEFPETVSFLGGEVISRLYHSGLKSWMIDAGVTGTILFETPVRHVNFFFRDENESVGSLLTVLDEDGDTLVSFAGNRFRWTNVDLKIPVGEPAIASMTLQNNGFSGYAVIDDFSFLVQPGGEGRPLRDPIPQPIRKTLFLAVGLETVATGLTAPNWGIFAPGGPENLLFVIDQTGIIWAINVKTGEKTVWLDLSDRIVPLGVLGPNSYDERGLLGLAFHPDYSENGLLYTYSSEPVNGPADFSTIPPFASANHQSVITEWWVPDPSNAASTVDPQSAREILRIDQPQFNHNAGGLSFGPDGRLYIGLGDGGASDDQGLGHGLSGNGQNPSNVLGSILRIDPDGSSSSNGEYGIPEDNPFLGARGFASEIFAFGFRNPYRFSFDSLTGRLFATDVGQSNIEEVNIVTPGGNYGWNLKEGSFFFDPNGLGPGFVTDVDPGVPRGLIDPIAEYDHDEGTAIIGGFVYRGEAIRFLRGRYVFGELAKTATGDGRIFLLTPFRRIRELRIAGRPSLGVWVLGFGEDSDGELYVLGNDTGTPFGETGSVMKIVPVR